MCIQDLVGPMWWCFHLLDGAWEEIKRMTTRTSSSDKQLVHTRKSEKHRDLGAWWKTLLSVVVYNVLAPRYFPRSQAFELQANVGIVREDRSDEIFCQVIRRIGKGIGRMKNYSRGYAGSVSSLDLNGELIDAGGDTFSLRSLSSTWE